MNYSFKPVYENLSLIVSPTNTILNVLETVFLYNRSAFVHAFFRIGLRHLGETVEGLFQVFWNTELLLKATWRWTSSIGRTQAAAGQLLHNFRALVNCVVR